MNKWWAPSKLFMGIEMQLAQRLAMPSDKVIGMNTLTPEYVGSDLAFWVDSDGDSVFNRDMLASLEPSLIEDMRIEKGTINIWLNTDNLITFIMEQFQSSGPGFFLVDFPAATLTTFAVEHTSLNTIFPINIGTLRGSVIGNATATFLVKCGHRVGTHFWVEDLSKRNAVILEGIKRLNLNLGDVARLRGKFDHELGRIYASVIFSIKQISENEKKLNAMFPQAITRLMVPECEAVSRIPVENYVHSDLYIYIRDKFIEAFKETLNQVGIEIDYFDLEYPIFARYSVDPAEQSDYGQRNVYYFGDLIRLGYDKIISVVPIEMLAQPTKEESVLARVSTMLRDQFNAEDDQIQFVPYGKVLVGNGSRFVEESISDGIFVSVDNLVGLIAIEFGVTRNVAASLMKVLLLSLDHNSYLEFDTSSKILDSYIYFRNILRQTLFTLSESSGQVNEDEIPLATTRYLIREIFTLHSVLLQQIEVPQKISPTVRVVFKIVEGFRSRENLIAKKYRLVLLLIFMLQETLESLGIQGRVDDEFGDVRKLLHEALV